MEHGERYCHVQEVHKTASLIYSPMTRIPYDWEPLYLVPTVNYGVKERENDKNLSKTLPHKDIHYGRIISACHAIR